MVRVLPSFYGNARCIASNAVVTPFFLGRSTAVVTTEYARGFDEEGFSCANGNVSDAKHLHPGPEEKWTPTAVSLRCH